MPGHASRKPVVYMPEDRGYATRCWIWQLSFTAGYGQRQFDGRRYVAHRWMYEQRVGPVPDGMHLDHLCGQPDCVNPSHLEPVTAQTNNRRSRATKLTADVVREIKRRASHLEGPTNTVAGLVAMQLDIPQSRVRDVLRGRSWADITT